MQPNTPSILLALSSLAIVQATPLWISNEAHREWLDKRADPAESSDATSAPKHSKTVAKETTTTHSKAAEHTTSIAQKTSHVATHKSQPTAISSHSTKSSSVSKATKHTKQSSKSSAAPKASSIPLNPAVVPAAQSPTPTTSLANSAESGSSGSSSSGVSSGAVAGIVVGVLAAVAGLVALVMVRRKKQQARSRAFTGKPDPFTMGFGSHNPPPLHESVYSTRQSIPPTPSYPMASASMAAVALPVQNVMPAIHASYTAESLHTPSPISALPSSFETDRPISGMSMATANTNTIGVGAMTAAGSAVMAYSDLSPPTSLGIFTVTTTYTPTLSDEIDIQPGDQVEVLTEYDDGWCQGINLSRGNARGVFPKHCIDCSLLPAKEQDHHQSMLEPEMSEPERSKRVSSMYMSFQVQD
ncbi:hypothetical protein CLU79DRAFT_764111, partial [Phycomyces nitens]